ncbi:MAG: GNAT family N-acetyltransferase [Longimicrobiales bacterium]
MSFEPRDTLRRILAEVDDLLAQTAGLRFDQFIMSEALRRAFTRSLEIIGEAAEEIVGALRSEFPSVDPSSVEIERYQESKLEEIVQLSLRAWEPVFASIESAMDSGVYRELYPDWRTAQRAAVESVCADADTHVWVASKESKVVGFVALQLHRENRMGEIYMIAVDPDHQRRGIATALTDHSLEWLKEAGMSVAMVETGEDPGHAPARRTYESAGFRRLPIARYFKKL